MEIINLTPHAVKLNDGRVFPASGRIARISTVFSEITDMDGIPVVNVSNGMPTGLPPQQDGVMYIVSGAMLEACPYRTDLLAPATGHPECIRKDGFIVSVPCFIKN